MISFMTTSHVRGNHGVRPSSAAKDS